MNRTLLIACIFVLTAILGILVWTNRSASADHTRRQTVSASTVVPAGTHVRIRLVEGITEGTKSGDTLQALTADPVSVDTQLAIPAGTRASVSVAGIQGQDPADVTMQLKELIFTSKHVGVRTGRVTARMQRVSDFEVIARAVGAMIGGAIGAANSASAGRNPTVGAGTVGGLSAGSATAAKTGQLLLFETLEPIDLTGVSW